MATASDQRTWSEELRRSSRLLTPLAGIPPATPADGPDPYGETDPEWLKIDWREHLRTGRRGRRPGSTTSRSARARRCSSSTGSRGCWQNWLENIPHFAAQPPGDRPRPARLRRQPDAAVGDLDPRLRPLHPRLLRAARDRAARALVGNSMGGFVATEAAIAEPARFERLVLVSAAGDHLVARRGASPPAVLGRVVRAAAPACLPLPDGGSAPPRPAAPRAFADRPRPRLAAPRAALGARHPGTAAPASTTR